MRIGAIFIALFLFYGSIALAQNLDTKMDSISYSVGYLMGKNLQQQGFGGLNYDDFKTGIVHALENEKSSLTDAEIEMNFKKAMMDIQSSQASAYEQNKLDGINFLAKNKTRTEVVVLPSGLQYEVLEEGIGEYPSSTDKVRTHYHGTLIDGTVFDSSVERGEPIAFPVNGVIKGWQEALQLMKVGSKWKLYVPYDLAYGDRAAGPAIKPFSTLIFEVELLAIE